MPVIYCVRHFFSTHIAFNGFMKRTTLYLLCLLIFCTRPCAAQQYPNPDPAYSAQLNDNGSNRFSLKDCIAFALTNQPAINQSMIDEHIAQTNKGIALAGWLPQVNAGMNYQHYFELPTVFFRNNGTLSPTTSGLANYSNPQIAVTQTLFSNDVFLAQRTARLAILLARENTQAARIALVTNVSKAFYDVLLSVQKTNVYREDTARLRKNMEDAYHRYVSGIADKVDYKQATISLNNALSRLKTSSEELKGKYALLKQYMGAPAEKNVRIAIDTVQMLQDIAIDTLSQLNITQRVEYRQLMLVKAIQQENTKLFKNGFLPSLSAFYTYNYQFQSNDFDQLYNKAYPNSLAGLQLNIPIFTGFRRLDNVHKSKLQEQRIDWDETNLKLGIYTEYQQALAAYKSNLYYLHMQSENAGMAREVYDIVKLQYKEGIKPYLDVIVGESDLQTAEINYLNALFQVLQSKLDLERASGAVRVN